MQSNVNTFRRIAEDSNLYENPKQQNEEYFLTNFLDLCIEMMDSGNLEIDSVMSYYEGKREFTDDEYNNILQFIDTIQIRKSKLIELIIRAKHDGFNFNVFPEHDRLIRLSDEIQIEEKLEYSFAKYDIVEGLHESMKELDQDYAIALMYNSKDCIEFLESLGAKKFEELTNSNIKNAVRRIDKLEVKLNYGNIKYWDVSKVTNMSQLFMELENFNSDISNWNVSNVTNMRGMFWNAKKFNANLSKWNTSNVIDKSHMFDGCENFNCDLSKWDVSNVTNMSDMFSKCTNFTSDLSKWNVRNVVDMSSMFYGAENFTTDLSNWDVRNVRYMSYMFYSNYIFTSDLSKWNVSKVRDMKYMFYFATSFNSDLSNWDVSQVTNMEKMFYYARSFNSDISNWDVSKVTTKIRDIFADCGIKKEYKFKKD